MVCYFHLTPSRKNSILRVDFYKKDAGPIGLPQNYSAWRSKWVAASGNWDKLMPGLIPTERRDHLSIVERRIPRLRNAELNLRFYVEDIHGEWKKLQRPWSSIKKHYASVDWRLVSQPYVEDVPPVAMDLDESNAFEVSETREDSSESEGADEYKNANDLEKCRADVSEAMLRCLLSEKDVMNALRLGLVDNHTAHAYIDTLAAQVVPEELRHSGRSSSVGEAQSKHRNDPNRTGASQFSDVRAEVEKRRKDSILRVNAELAMEKAKGKRPAK